MDRKRHTALYDQNYSDDDEDVEEPTLEKKSNGVNVEFVPATFRRTCTSNGVLNSCSTGRSTTDNHLASIEKLTIDPTPIGKLTTQPIKISPGGTVWTVPVGSAPRTLKRNQKKRVYSEALPLNMDEEDRNVFYSRCFLEQLQLNPEHTDIAAKALIELSTSSRVSREASTTSRALSEALTSKEAAKQRIGTTLSKASTLGGASTSNYAGASTSNGISSSTSMLSGASTSNNAGTSLSDNAGASMSNGGGGFTSNGSALANGEISEARALTEEELKTLLVLMELRSFEASTSRDAAALPTNDTVIRYSSLGDASSTDMSSASKNGAQKRKVSTLTAASNTSGGASTSASNGDSHSIDTHILTPTQSAVPTRIIFRCRNISLSLDIWRRETAKTTETSERFRALREVVPNTSNVPPAEVPQNTEEHIVELSKQNKDQQRKTARMNKYNELADIESEMLINFKLGVPIDFVELQRIRQQMIKYNGSHDTTEEDLDSDEDPTLEEDSDYDGDEDVDLDFISRTLSGTSTSDEVKEEQMSPTSPLAIDENSIEELTSPATHISPGGTAWAVPVGPAPRARKKHKQERTCSVIQTTPLNLYEPERHVFFTILEKLQRNPENTDEIVAAALLELSTTPCEEASLTEASGSSSSEWAEPPSQKTGCARALTEPELITLRVLMELPAPGKPVSVNAFTLENEVKLTEADALTSTGGGSTSTQAPGLTWDTVLPSLMDASLQVLRSKGVAENTDTTVASSSTQAASLSRSVKKKTKMRMKKKRKNSKLKAASTSCGASTSTDAVGVLTLPVSIKKRVKKKRKDLRLRVASTPCGASTSADAGGASFIDASTLTQVAVLSTSVAVSTKSSNSKRRAKKRKAAEFTSASTSCGTSTSTDALTSSDASASTSTNASASTSTDTSSSTSTNAGALTTTGDPISIPVAEPPKTTKISISESSSKMAKFSTSTAASTSCDAFTSTDPSTSTTIDTHIITSHGHEVPTRIIFRGRRVALAGEIWQKATAKRMEYYRKRRAEVEARIQALREVVPNTANLPQAGVITNTAEHMVELSKQYEE